MRVGAGSREDWESRPRENSHPAAEGRIRPVRLGLIYIIYSTMTILA